MLGAGGGTGGAVAPELDRLGHRARAVNRGGNAVVLDCAQPAYGRWPKAFPPMNEAVIRAPRRPAPAERLREADAAGTVRVTVGRSRTTTVPAATWRDTS